MATATGAYSGRWRRSFTAEPPPQFASERHPEHLHPTPEPEPGPVPWRSTVDAPGLPGEVLHTGGLDMPSGYGLGPVYEPQPGTTLAPMPGLSIPDAQAARGTAHMHDDGGPAVSGWTHPQGTDDVRHLDDYHLSGQGSPSPHTLRLQATGVESPEDPGARRSRRIQRWIDRRIDMHRFEPVFPGKRTKNATSAHPQFPPDTPTQRDSHGSTIVTPSAALATLVPDKFVEPVVRTPPGDWQEPITPVDFGTGLTVWGA